MKTCSHENLYIKVNRSFVYNRQKLETPHISFNRWTDEPVMIHPYDEILFRNKTVWTIYTCNNVEWL